MTAKVRTPPRKNVLNDASNVIPNSWLTNQMLLRTPVVSALQGSVTMLKTADGEPAIHYPLSDQALHQPGVEELWQESVVLTWGDLKADVGGFLRIGRVPNLDRGEMTLWSYIYSPDHIYGASRDFPMVEGDCSACVMSAGGMASYEFDGVETRWRHDGDAVVYDLKTESFHPPLPLWRPGDGALAHPHFEASGRLTGEVCVEGRTHRIDGLYHRDQSWGVRNWLNRKTHRWFNGVFGPDLSFCLLTFHGQSDQIMRIGYVVRDGIVHYSTKVDVIPFMEPDGATHRGGVAEIILDDGERLEFSATPICKGFYAYRSGSAIFESPCRDEHEGRIGYGDFEISENARAGLSAFGVLVNSIPTDGMFAR
jgi:hypothetical protein